MTECADKMSGMITDPVTRISWPFQCRIWMSRFPQDIFPWMTWLKQQKAASVSYAKITRYTGGYLFNIYRKKLIVKQAKKSEKNGNDRSDDGPHIHRRGKYTGYPEGARSCLSIGFQYFYFARQRLVVCHYFYEQGNFGKEYNGKELLNYEKGCNIINYTNEESEQVWFFIWNNNGLFNTKITTKFCKGDRQKWML